MAQMIQNGVGNASGNKPTQAQRSQIVRDVRSGAVTGVAGGSANATTSKKPLKTKKQATQNSFGMAGSSASAARANRQKPKWQVSGPANGGSAYRGGK